MDGRMEWDGWMDGMGWMEWDEMGWDVSTV